MRFLILSDTHGSRTLIDRVLRQCTAFDGVFHAGDTVADAQYIEKIIAPKPCYYVRGNGDRYGSAESVLLLEVEGTRVLLVHGHEDAVKYSMIRLQCRAQEAEARLVIYGHSHIPSVDYERGIWFVNPGSIKEPRAGSPRTFGLVEIEKAAVYPTVVRLEEG